ncbi:MAG: extracellular solute-binding protein [Spirochaetales bacterium]|nr:extracellular solute-binding protein [Spirochaetales bacterium]
MKMEDLPVFEVLQEQTGKKITFIHPPVGQYELRFKLMLASGKLPDIISHDFLNDYPGGMSGAVDDGIVLPLDGELLREALNLRAFLEENPEAAADIQLPDGSYACFPSCNADEGTSTYMGPFIRRDLLKKHGLEMPETLEDWEEVLSSFQADPAIDTPLTFYGGNIVDTRFMIGTFGIDWSFLFRDGKIIYGPAEPAFINFVKCFRSWYQNGWMDPGVLINSRRAYIKAVEQNTAGIYVDYVSNILTYERLLQKKNPEAELLPLAYPRFDETAPVPPGHDSGRFIPFASAYITTAADDPAAIARTLDYIWSPEGRRLFNFGIQGESYNLTNDKPTFLSAIFEKEGIGGYKYYLVAGPYLKDREAFMQSLRLPVQKEAVRLWAAGLTEENRRSFLPMTGGEKGARLMDLKSTLDSYAFETAVDVISGKAGDDRLEKLREDLQDLGLAEALELCKVPD